MDEKYFCRSCKGFRNQKQLFEIKRNGSEFGGDFQWVNKYIVIECSGCETVSFLKIYGNTEMIQTDEDGNTDYYFDKTIYPYYLEDGEELENLSYVPPVIRTIYKETIEALKADSPILAAGGLRAVIKATCNHLKIRKKDLAERINLLHENGHITLNESKRLHSIRFLGNDALHEIDKPKKEQLYLLLEIVNHLLSNLFISDNKMKGTVEVLIDDFSEFLKLVRNKLNKEMVGKEFTMEQILGKSKRLIPSKHYKLFVERIKEQAQNNKHDFIEVKLVQSKTLFKVLKEPNFNFEDW